MRGTEVTPMPRRALGWIGLGLLAVACSTPAPAPVAPSAAPVAHVLKVIAAGPDGAVAGLRVCAVALAGAQSCAPTGPDGVATLTLAAGTYQVRSETPASQRRVGGLGGADPPKREAPVRLEFEKIRRIAGTIRDP